MCQDKTARIIIKQGSGVPTIPVSADHRNGDWIATDIYEGEQYMDTDTGIVYTRSSTGIEAVGGGAGGIQPKIWRAQVTQTGTNAPVLTELINTLGVTVTTGYTGTGTYSLSGFNSNLTGLVAIECNHPLNLFGTNVTFFANTSSTCVLSTRDSTGTYTDGLLSTSGSLYLSQILTVTKYD